MTSRFSAVFAFGVPPLCGHKINAANVLRLCGQILAGAIVTLAAGWGLFALWYQAPGGHAGKIAIMLVWAVFACAVVASFWQGRALFGLAAFALAFAALLVWWCLIPAGNDRVWADDVSRLATGTIDGNLVTLHDVRDFDWRSANDFTERWQTRTYDLNKLESVDMIMSYWRGPSIAHMLVSFGFDGGAHVVFSVEIRRKKGEAFSEIGGFFKQFELSIIAADENDIIRVRTNVRGEDDYLYRVSLSREHMRSLFIAYVEQANSLARVPRFYNTVTVNCTTLVYHMMKRIVGRLPFDYRVVFTGYLPEYVYQVGGLDQRYPLQELRQRGRITDRAKRADRAGFSTEIRRGIPPLPAAD
jgi:hypothetical protein